MSVRSGQRSGADDDMAVCIAPAQALGDRKDANHIVMLLNLARDGVNCRQCKRFSIQSRGRERQGVAASGVEAEGHARS